MNLAGPDEQLRRRIVDTLAGLQTEWKHVRITSDGKVTIRFADGTETILEPPPPTAS